MRDGALQESPHPRRALIIVNLQTKYGEHKYIKGQNCKGKNGINKK